MDDEAPPTAPPTAVPTQASGVVTLNADQLQSLIQQLVATTANMSDTVHTQKAAGKIKQENTQCAG